MGDSVAGGSVGVLKLQVVVSAYNTVRIGTTNVIKNERIPVISFSTGRSRCLQALNRDHHDFFLFYNFNNNTRITLVVFHLSVMLDSV